jgi:hypothetical protein
LRVLRTESVHSRMSHANVAAAVRGSMEIFDDVLRVHTQLATDLAHHDARQERFKRQFARETRRHHSAISGLACVANALPGSNAVLYAATSTKHETDSDPFDQPVAPARRGSTVMRQLQRLQHPQTHVLRDALACFYLPPVVTTDIVCDSCGAFKTANQVPPLPEPWKEYTCDDSGKRYFYDAMTQSVLWAPPPDASPFSAFVFQRTNSVSTVCRCIPSHARRQCCMEKFRAYAKEAAQEETEQRNRRLHGAFRTLAHKVAKHSES